jgi:LytS/YehU family sensor histidine kinase
LKDYLELMKIRMGKRLAYRLDLPTKLASKLVPSLILQSLVENSIVHGLEPKVAGGTIRVTAFEQDSQLVIEITDDGVGFNSENSADGFGLTQVRDRLETHYGTLATFAIKSAKNADADIDTGTKTTLRLPI